jgi:hypothetical protein
MFRRLASGWIFTASSPVSSSACLAAASQTSPDLARAAPAGYLPDLAADVAVVVHGEKIPARPSAGKENAHL